MTATDSLPSADVVDSKSRVGELQEKIDELLRQFYATPDPALMSRMTELSKEKEQLMKPALLRSNFLKKAS